MVEITRARPQGMLRPLALLSSVFSVVAIATALFTMFGSMTTGAQNRYMIRYLESNNSASLSAAFMAAAAKSQMNATIAGTISDYVRVSPTWQIGAWAYDLHYSQACFNGEAHLSDEYYGVRCTSRSLRRSFSLPEYVLYEMARPQLPLQPINDGNVFTLSDTNFGVFASAAELGASSTPPSFERRAVINAVRDLFQQVSSGLNTWAAEKPLSTFGPYCLISAGVALSFIALISSLSAALFERLNMPQVHGIGAIFNCLSTILFLASAIWIRQIISNALAGGTVKPLGDLVDGFEYKTSTSTAFSVLTWLPLAFAVFATNVSALTTARAARVTKSGAYKPIGVPDIGTGRKEVPEEGIDLLPR